MLSIVTSKDYAVINNNTLFLFRKKLKITAHRPLKQAETE